MLRLQMRVRACNGGDTKSRGDVLLPHLTANTTERHSLTAAGAQVNEAPAGRRTAKERLSHHKSSEIARDRRRGGHGRWGVGSARSNLCKAGLALDPRTFCETIRVVRLGLDARGPQRRS